MLGQICCADLCPLPVVSPCVRRGAVSILCLLGCSLVRRAVALTHDRRAAWKGTSLWKNCDHCVSGVCVTAIFLIEQLAIDPTPKKHESGNPGVRPIANPLVSPHGCTPMSSSCCLPRPAAGRTGCIGILACDLDHDLTPSTAAVTLTLYLVPDPSPNPQSPGSASSGRYRGTSIHLS